MPKTYCRKCKRYHLKKTNCPYYGKRGKGKRKGGKKRKGGNFGGYKVKPDKNLQPILGKKSLSPPQMTKKVWSYIKKHNLGGKGK